MPVLLHMAGKSKAKGTQALLAAWLMEDWERGEPMLDVFTTGAAWSEDDKRLYKEHGVRLHTEYISPSTRIARQKTSSIHVCPSEAEGYGHYIAEGLRYGCLVVTTDGAPMNELVTPDRGILVKPTSQEARMMGVGYLHSPATLRAAINRALSMKEDEYDYLTRQGHAYYEEAYTFFRARLPQVLNRFAL